MVKSIALASGQSGAVAKPHWAIRAHSNAEAVQRITQTSELSHEDMQIVMALNEAADDMAYIHSCFDHITEEILIDCLIYELKAASLRHKYYLGMCKENGIIRGGIK